MASYITLRRHTCCRDQYKGEFSLGFNHVGLGDGWIRHGDFSLKVLCEDGRAQITLTVPDIVAVYNRSGLTIQRTMEEFVNDIFEYKGRREFKGTYSHLIALLRCMPSKSNQLYQRSLFHGLRASKV